MVILPALEPIEPPPSEPRQLRAWWHEVIRKHGHYPCFALFVAFGADEQVDLYLMENAAELSRASGKHCLMIVHSNLGFVDLGPDMVLWHLVLTQQVRAAHAAVLAEVFDVSPDDFPCLLFFRQVPSPDRVVLPLKGLNQDGIAAAVHSALMTVTKASSRKKDPLVALLNISHRQPPPRNGGLVDRSVGTLHGSLTATRT